jgi:hypothetical protein
MKGDSRAESGSRRERQEPAQSVKLHVHFQTGELRVNEVVEGENAEQVVAAMQERAAKQAGFLIGAVIRRMTPLQFAQEATRRYNAAMKDNAPLPQTCDEFVRLGVEKNFASLVEA